MLTKLKNTKNEFEIRSNMNPHSVRSVPKNVFLNCSQKLEFEVKSNMKMCLNCSQNKFEVMSNINQRSIRSVPRNVFGQFHSTYIKGTGDGSTGNS